MDVLYNKLKRLGAGGAVGRLIRANRDNWVNRIPDDDPGLFDGFFDKNDGSVFRTMWHGEYPGKLLTGIAQTYLIDNDEETRRTGDLFTEKLSEAQEKDGYLGPWKEQVRYEKDVSPENYGKWDTWGVYHCVYGLYGWYKATGNKKALETAKKALDNVYRHFFEGGIPLYSQNWAECNLAIGHAFALFYGETGDDRYLSAAIRTVERDWNGIYDDFYTKRKLCCGWMKAALDGIPYFRSGQPRWEGLYALETLAELYRLTGKDEYRAALCSLYRGIRDNDRHNTGSFGTGEGATGDLYGSGSETCNTVAWTAFAAEYLKVTKDPTAADELELSFFNAALGSLLSGERDFTYMNDSNGRREPAHTVLGAQSYKGAPDMSCCQANGNRGITQITEWAALTGPNGVYLNYYGESSVVTETADGYGVVITQNTDYPKSGVISLSVSSGSTDELTVYFRIPAWSRDTDFYVNGKRLDASPGAYLAVKRAWRDGDRVEIRLDMTAHFWLADDGRISVYSGPVLLAHRGEDSVFTLDGIARMEPTEGEGLVRFETDSPDGRKTLTDYYTAGKYGDTYYSWLRFDGENTGLFTEDGAPVWCARYENDHEKEKRK